MYYLVTETGTYQKSYVVQSDHPLGKPESLVDGSFSYSLAENDKLIGKLSYTSELIDEKSKLDFSIKTALGILGSIEEIVPEVTKPKKTRKRPDQAEQLEKPVGQTVTPKQERAASTPKPKKSKVDWDELFEES